MSGIEHKMSACGESFKLKNQKLWILNHGQSIYLTYIVLCLLEILNIWMDHLFSDGSLVSHRLQYVLQVMGIWAGPGNEARNF